MMNVKSDVLESVFQPYYSAGEGNEEGVDRNHGRWERASHLV